MYKILQMNNGIGINGMYFRKDENGKNLEFETMPELKKYLEDNFKNINFTNFEIVKNSNHITDFRKSQNSVPRKIKLK